jgi:ABC-type cobalamin/Fe3+-siderophores transport system ATPase subunit
MVTHAHRTAAAMCDRVVLMKEGRIWSDGDPGKLLLPVVLDRLYESDTGEEGFQ